MKHRKYYDEHGNHIRERDAYKATSNAPNSKMLWSEDEIKLVKDRELHDIEIAKITGRSVLAVQIKRHRINKEVNL